MDECVTRGVASADRVIATIGEHVIAEHTLAGRCKCVGVDKTADCGVVITGLQVIESSILGADIAVGSIFALLPLVFKTENQGRFVKLLPGARRRYPDFGCGCQAPSA
jgi:hypothetical protein